MPESPFWSNWLICLEEARSKIAFPTTRALPVVAACCASCPAEAAPAPAPAGGAATGNWLTQVSHCFAAFCSAQSLGIGVNRRLLSLVSSYVLSPSSLCLLSVYSTQARWLFICRFALIVAAPGFIFLWLMSSLTAINFFSWRPRQIFWRFCSNFG